MVAFSDHLVHHEEEDTIVDQLVDRQEDDGAQGGRVREDKVTGSIPLGVMCRCGVGGRHEGGKKKWDGEESGMGRKVG